MTEYSSVSEYTDAGFIYVHAGCRGRDAGAPAGVTDLKAAIRYIRYNDENIAGDMDSIFTFGMSGGGAQSALLGVTGDSELYNDYLEAIGAVMGVSDAVLGSQGWCPIISLDSADEAYEWMMGTTRSGLSDEEQSISDGLTAAYAEYINSLELTDSEGNVLTLEAGEDGRYQSGSYYDYMVSVIEESLNNFLADTSFPYDADASSQGHQAGMGPGGRDGFGGGPGENKEGYQSSNVAKYFRINTGLWQSDTAVNTEANLVLALQNYGSDVDYSFVWGQEHTMAERSGDSTTNFIDWVNECVKAEAQ